MLRYPMFFFSQSYAQDQKVTTYDVECINYVGHCNTEAFTKI